MKKWMCAAVLLCLALAAGAALAEEDSTMIPQIGFAVCVPERMETTAAMYEKPNEDSNVLMNYFSGTTAEVKSVEDGWAHVVIGADKAKLEGYMHEEDLRYGAQAQRDREQCVFYLLQCDNVPVYEAPNMTSDVINYAGEMWSNEVVGIKADDENGMWMQIDAESWKRSVYKIGGGVREGVQLNAGFMYVKETEYMGAFEWFDPSAYERAEGELTFEEVYERALDVFLSGENDSEGFVAQLPEGFQGEEGLRKMSGEVRIVKKDGDLCWWVTLTDEADDSINVSLFLTMDGEVIGEVSHLLG